MKKLVSAIVNYCWSRIDDDDNNNNDDDSNNDKVINFVIRVDKLNILLQKRLESRRLERKSLVRILILNLHSLKKKSIESIYRRVAVGLNIDWWIFKLLCAWNVFIHKSNIVKNVDYINVISY